MQRFNAIDAIVPAFTRTHAVLARPFRWGRSWKLAAASYLGWCGSLFLPLPLLFAYVPWRQLAASSSAMLPVAAAAAVGSTLLFLVLFYLGARMRLVNFEVLVTGAKMLGPIWRRYGSRVWPTVLAKVALGTVLTGIAAPLLLRSGRTLFFAYGDLLQITGPRALAPGMNPAALHAFLAALLPFYAVFLPFLLLLRLFSSLLEDIALPFFQIEDIPLSAAITRAWSVVVAEPLEVIGFMLMKVVYFIAGLMIVYGSYVVLLLTVALIFGFAAGAAALLFSSGAGASVIGLLLIIVGVLLYLLLSIVLLWYLIGAIGCLSMLLDAHAMYFLAGRYRRLAELLGLAEPPAPSSFIYAPPPLPPSREEEKSDDGDEPPMPMDPALA